jgi:transcription antitermination factor NusG
MKDVVSAEVEFKKNERAPKWHIAYTFPKAERKANKKLELMGVATFLPLHMVIRKWSDRKKKLEVPLFPNYIFINTTEHQRYEILQIKELVRYVSFDGKPAIVSETLIESLRKMLKGSVEVSDEEFYEGMHVRVTNGLFMGAEGILVRKNSKSRLVIQIKVLRRTVSVDISSSSIIPVQHGSSNASLELLEVSQQ